MLPNSRLGTTAGRRITRITTSRLLEPLVTRMFAGDEESFVPRDHPRELDHVRGGASAT